VITDFLDSTTDREYMDRVKRMILAEGKVKGCVAAHIMPTNLPA